MKIDFLDNVVVFKFLMGSADPISPHFANNPSSSFVNRNGEILPAYQGNDKERFGDRDVQLGIQNFKTGNYIDFRCVAK